MLETLRVSKTTAAFYASLLLVIPLTACSHFNKTGNMTVDRSDHTDTLLPDGTVLITGGFSKVTGTLTDVELYDPTSKTFTNAGQMAATRGQHTATLVPSNKKILMARS
jgi:hypothetical protein